jgi:2-polyprenyl-6-methoxyphenol hydroxylase-like FAD-dependent oxidoreductase
MDRALQRRFLRRSHPFVALKAHMRDLPLPGRIELHAFRGGYCGMSELERSAYGAVGAGASNVCLLAHESVFRAAGAAGPQRLPAFLRWMRSQNPRLAEQLSRATLLSERWLSVGQVPFDDKSPVEGDVLMAGDAAGLIAPLAGDGIAMALRSGELAAAYCAAHLCGGMSAGGLRRGYAAAWRREFGARVRLGRLLQTLMLRPDWFWPGLHLLRAVPRLGQYLVAHTRGTAVGAFN